MHHGLWLFNTWADDPRVQRIKLLVIISLVTTHIFLKEQYKQYGLIFFILIKHAHKISQNLANKH